MQHKYGNYEASLQKFKICIKKIKKIETFQATKETPRFTTHISELLTEVTKLQFTSLRFRSRIFKLQLQ